MVDLLTRKEIQDFILAHEQDDEKELVLKHRMIHGVSSTRIAEQIKGRRKAKTKIPLYYNTKNIVYPTGLSMEQSSSEEAAIFKASILRSALAKTEALVDLTGGFGVDTFFLSKVFKNITYIDPNPELVPIAHHNHRILGALNTHHINTTAEEFLSATERVDCFFLDPSRRSKTKQKVFKFSDCEPNVETLLPILFEKSNYALIKAAPLLDIQQAIKELKHVKKVWVVSVDNECKELLFLCCKKFVGEVAIEAINLSDNPESFSFTFSEERKVATKFCAPLTYIYEPNASILKSGAFKSITSKFPVFKLHQNTHLYTSSAIIEEFPGRIFKVLSKVKPNPKDLKVIFPEGKANIITRNYPLSVKDIKKKTKLKDGGALFLLGLSGQKEKYLLAAERIK